MTNLKAILAAAAIAGSLIAGPVLAEESTPPEPEAITLTDSEKNATLSSMALLKCFSDAATELESAILQEMAKGNVVSKEVIDHGLATIKKECEEHLNWTAEQAQEFKQSLKDKYGAEWQDVVTRSFQPKEEPQPAPAPQP